MDERQRPTVQVTSLEVKAPGEGTGPWNLFKAAAPAPAFQPLAEGRCALA